MGPLRTSFKTEQVSLPGHNLQARRRVPGPQRAQSNPGSGTSSSESLLQRSQRPQRLCSPSRLPPGPGVGPRHAQLGPEHEQPASPVFHLTRCLRNKNVSEIGKNQSLLADYWPMLPRFLYSATPCEDLGGWKCPVPYQSAGRGR